MEKPIYALVKDVEWGETVWMLVAPGCSPLGRYPTQALAKQDGKGLKIVRRADLDFPSRGQKGY